MYSVVLMMALTSGGDTPDMHRGGGCCGGGGCYGGGCHGGGRRHGRRGGGCCGGGCYGGCYGGVGYGYGGCYGGGYGGCYGSMGGGCYGGTPMMPGGTAPEKLKKEPTEKKSSTQASPSSATIVVSLPADAKLLIDNEATTSVGDSRVFVSPTLNPGREYHYTLKAQAVRDGKPVTVERVIAVRAGEITPASLTLPATGVAQR
jgi:uncharacterized protein (TIGR03000 family)